MEECNELSMAISKALRFGMNNYCANLLQMNHPYQEYISFRKGLGFYHTPSVYTKKRIGKFRYKECEPIKDDYAVFRLRKDGSLEPIMDSDRSKRFHNELLDRRMRRQFSKENI